MLHVKAMKILAIRSVWKRYAITGNYKLNDPVVVEWQHLQK